MNRNISYHAAIAIVVGCIIGSGIFLKPASMAQQLDSPYWLIGVWIAAGLITLTGALTTAELASLFPETGGQYVFFKKIYGSFIAYLYGWASVFVFNTAGIASIAYVASYYVDFLIPLPRFDLVFEQKYYIPIYGIGKLLIFEHFGRKTLTIFILIIFSIINSKSLSDGANTQKILSWMKVILILVLSGAFIIFGNNNTMMLNETVVLSHQSMQGLIAAFAGAFWCYDGWNNIGFVGGEIRNPQRIIPRSLLYGIILCISIYVLFNVSLLCVMDFKMLSQGNFIAAEAAQQIWKKGGSIFVVIIVIVSVIGAVNGNILACARVTYSFFKDFRFFTNPTRLNRANVPAGSIWLNTIWASILVLTGSFDQLTDMLIFVSWIFYALSAIGLILYRSKTPSYQNQYKVPMYPWLPLIFICFSIFYLSITLYYDFYNYSIGESHLVKSGFGLLLVAIGVPFYFTNKRYLNL